uniref:Sema domain-containing protein n=1 Tax=Anguilla anguilla TaxID=7936 RepID=A0A0E9RQZ6_ANGAN
MMIFFSFLFFIKINSGFKICGATARPPYGNDCMSNPFSFFNSYT